MSNSKSTMSQNSPKSSHSRSVASKSSALAAYLQAKVCKFYALSTVECLDLQLKSSQPSTVNDANVDFSDLFALCYSRNIEITRTLETNSQGSKQNRSQNNKSNLRKYRPGLINYQPTKSKQLKQNCSKSVSINFQTTSRPSSKKINFIKRNMVTIHNQPKTDRFEKEPLTLSLNKLKISETNFKNQDLQEIFSAMAQINSLVSKGRARVWMREGVTPFSMREQRCY